MRVLVLEGIVRECLAVVRSLGRRGITIDVADSNRINPTRFSKYVSKFYIYPDPKDKREDFLKWLIRHIKIHSYDMIFPLNDYTYEICTRYQNEIRQHTSVAVNDWETFELARDKAKTIKYAQKIGIPVPLTWFPKSKEDLFKLEKEIPTYPVIIKPTKSSGSRGFKKLNNKKELFTSYEILSKKFGSMLVQEYIPGREILDVSVLFNMKSELRAALVSNRIRMFPVEGGPNVAGHAVINEPLRQQAIKLMKSLKWKGVALVEFKVDPRDNVPKLMEINPRFWGSTQLGISAGIDWPWLLFNAVVKGDCETKMNYRTDRLVRWLLPGELLHFLTCKNKKDLWPDFFHFFNSNTEYYIFSKDDVMPVLGLLLTMLIKIFDPKMIRYFLTRR